MPNYTSIGIDRHQFDELRAVKERWQDRAGRRFYWGDFLMMLLTLHESRAETTPTVELHQEEESLSEEQLREMDWEYDEVTTEQVRQMLGPPGGLSEDTIEAIAERVAQKVMEKLREMEGE